MDNIWGDDMRDYELKSPVDEIKELTELRNPFESEHNVIFSHDVIVKFID